MTDVRIMESDNGDVDTGTAYRIFDAVTDELIEGAWEHPRDAVVRAFDLGYIVISVGNRRVGGPRLLSTEGEEGQRQ
jgi:hypothetical protein